MAIDRWIPGAGYTVSLEHGCRVVRGALPVQDFARLLEEWTGGQKPADPQQVWVADPVLSAALGVCMVCGSRRDTSAWRAVLDL